MNTILETKLFRKYTDHIDCIVKIYGTLYNPVGQIEVKGEFWTKWEIKDIVSDEKTVRHIILL